MAVLRIRGSDGKNHVEAPGIPFAGFCAVPKQVEVNATGPRECANWPAARAVPVLTFQLTIDSNSGRTL